MRLCVVTTWHCVKDRIDAITLATCYTRTDPERSQLVPNSLTLLGPDLVRLGGALPLPILRVRRGFSVSEALVRPNLPTGEGPQDLRRVNSARHMTSYKDTLLLVAVGTCYDTNFGPCSDAAHSNRIDRRWRWRAEE